MTDISEKKDKAKKEIRALLLSTNLGLTPNELKKDYLDLVGPPLPGENFGYNSFEDFIKDIPDVVQVNHEGANLILKAVADSTTRHIEKLVSRQKVDSRKQMKVLAKRNAEATWQRSQRPLQSLAPRFYQAPNQRTHRNFQNPNHNTNRFGRGGGTDGYGGGQRNSHTMNNRIPPRHRQQAHHRTMPFVPAHIQRDIHSLVYQHREGLPLTHFSRIYRSRYQVHLDPPHLGYQDEYDLLASIPNVVSLKRFQQGEMRVLPVGAPGDGRPHDRHHSGENNQNKSSHSSSSSPPQHKLSGEDRNRPSPKSQDDENTLFDKGASSNIPQYIESRLQKMMSGRPEGIKASHLLSEYKNIFKIDLPIKSYGYNSAIEFASDLSHIIRSERPNKFDWVLYPIESASSDPTTNNQAIDAYKKNNPSAAPKDWNVKMPSASPPSIPSLLAIHKVEWEVKEAISQVLSLNPKGIPLGQFVDTYEEMTGRELKVKKYGVETVKGFLHSLKDVVYIMLDESDQQVVCLTHEGGPRKFDLLRDKYKPVTPAPQPQPSASRQHQQQQSQSAYPPQAVTPGCFYKPQPVTYINTGDASEQQKYIEVYVSFTTSPGHFWVQLRGDKTTIALEDVMDDLEQCYGSPLENRHVTKEKEYHMTPEFAKPGMVCAVIYPEDMFWHRGLITGCKDNLYEVFFVDYGNTCYVLLQNMRLLKTKFLTLPAQAIRARLSNVEPLHQTWSVRARQRFLDLTKERPLLGFVTAFKHRILSLCLTDTSGHDDIHINDLMTHEGYARFKPDTDDCMNAEDKQSCNLQVLTTDFLYGKEQMTASSSSASAGAGGGGGGGDDKPHHHHRTSNGGGHITARGGGGDGAATWRRYVRQAQMSDNHVFNLIFLGGKDMYLMSSEISSLFFTEDIISAKLCSDKKNISKVVVTKDEYPDLYEELLSYEVRGVNQSTDQLSLFPLNALPLIMEMYGKGKDLEEIKDIVLTILDWFDPNDPYWKGEEDNGEEEEEEEDVTTESASVVSDSKESFKMDDLNMVLQMLQMKRTRSLKALLEGGGAGNKASEVNALNQVEIDIRRVEALINSLEEKNAGKEVKQQKTFQSGTAGTVGTSSSSSSSSSAAVHHHPSKTHLQPTSSVSSSQQQQRQQLLRQPNPVISNSSTAAAAVTGNNNSNNTGIIPPVMATVAPTPKLTSSTSTAAPSSSSLLSSSSSQPLSSLSSSMLAGLGGMGGLGGLGGMGGMGLGRGFGIPSTSGLAGFGGSTMDMGEMLRQQMNMNSLLMSQMGMMNTAPVMPTLPMNMEQMQQQQQALLQQQLLVQQQQQQQQLLLRCQQQQQQQQSLRAPSLMLSASALAPPSSSTSSSLSSTIPQAPGFSDLNPLVRGQLQRNVSNNVLNKTGVTPPSLSSKSSASVSAPFGVMPPPPGTNPNNNNNNNNNNNSSSNMFCASLGRVLSSALNEETNNNSNSFPSTGMAQQQGQGHSASDLTMKLRSDLHKMNLNK